jgi:hypothetical protein
MDPLPTDQIETLSADDFATQRTGRRDSLMLAAGFRVDGAEEARVRVRNLSPGGLMADHPTPVAPGTPVAVEVRGVGWVSGRIAWCAESRVGVAFDGEIDPLRARKPVGKGAHTPDYVKPVLPRR